MRDDKKQDAWKKVEQQRGRLNFNGFKNDGYHGFYGDQNMGLDTYRSLYESHYGKGPKGYRRSDALILEEANEALYESYEVDATHIEVEVKDGIVTLQGYVTDRRSKREAEKCVECLDGVLDVQNRLTIKASTAQNGLINGDLSRNANFS